MTLHESALKSWEGFRGVGASAGALTGPCFVVLTLGAEAGVIRGSREMLAAFGSPNVVHFCAALLVSALFSAPWPGLGTPAVAIGVTGASGPVQSVAVLAPARHRRDHEPVLEDWIRHAALPVLAYSALVVAGSFLPGAAGPALQVVGGSTPLPVFIGIHNAWATVTRVPLERVRARRAEAGPGAVMGDLETAG